MEKRLFMFLGLVLLLSFSSCDIDTEENFQFVTLEVISADMPESFTAKTTYDINVTYRRPDSCTFFSNFDIANNKNNQHNIVVIGSFLTKETCTDTNDEVTAVLKFTPQEIGSYHFRFYKGVNDSGAPEYVEYMITVKPAVD